MTTLSHSTGSSSASFVVFGAATPALCVDEQYDYDFQVYWHGPRLILHSDFQPELELAVGQRGEQVIYVTADESALLKRVLMASVKAVE